MIAVLTVIKGSSLFENGNSLAKLDYKLLEHNT